MNEKLYCDRCERIDKECGQMVLLNFLAARYTNLRKSLQDDATGLSDRFNRAIGRWTPLCLCDDCYISFMDFKTSGGVVDETPQTGNPTLTAPN